MANSEPKLPDVQAQELREVNTLLELDPETTDPARHYRWCRSHPLQVGKAKMRGYIIEEKREGGVRTLAGYLDDTGDGTMRVGDVILMSCDVKMYRKRKRAQVKQSEARLSAPAKQFKRNARRRRVRVIRDEEGDE
jgi:hypothetical protein